MVQSLQLGSLSFTCDLRLKKKMQAQVKVLLWVGRYTFSHQTHAVGLGFIEKKFSQYSCSKVQNLAIIGQLWHVNFPTVACFNKLDSYTSLKSVMKPFSSAHQSCKTLKFRFFYTLSVYTPTPNTETISMRFYGCDAIKRLQKKSSKKKRVNLRRRKVYPRKNLVRLSSPTRQKEIVFHKQLLIPGRCGWNVFAKHRNISKLSILSIFTRFLRELSH
jgi:hypothetical protein